MSSVKDRGLWKAAVSGMGHRGVWRQQIPYFGVFKETRIDYIFLPCVPFIPGLNFLGERQAGHEEKKKQAATPPKPLKGS